LSFKFEKKILVCYIHKCTGKLAKLLTELTTITTPSERTLASLSERSLLSSKIHGITLQIHDSVLVILNYVNFIPARLFDITVSSWPAVQGTRWLGTHDAFHRGWQFLLQIWTLNKQKEEMLHVSYWIALKLTFKKL